MGFIKSFQTTLSFKDDELKAYVRIIATDIFHIPDQEFSFSYEAHLLPVLLFMTNDQRACVMEGLADMLRVDQDPDNPSAFPALGAHAGIIRLLADWVTATTSRGNTGLAGPMVKESIIWSWINWRRQHPHGWLMTPRRRLQSATDRLCLSMQLQCGLRISTAARTPSEKDLRIT